MKGAVYGKKNPKSSFPAPKYRLVRDTDTRKNASAFFVYWKNLKPEHLETCSVKVYRLWPVCDFKLVDPNRKDVTETVFEGAMPFDVPEDYIQWALDTLSSGEWKFIMNEAGVEDSICEACFTGIDLTSQNPDGSDKYPPRVNLKAVLWGADRNKAFKRYLQARNIQVPGENPQEEQEQEEMNAANSAMDHFSKMADKVIDAKVAVAELQAQAQAEPSPQDVATNHAIETVASASGKAIDMVVQQAERLGKASAPQYDPIQMIRTAAEIMRPEKDDGVMVKLLVETMNSSHAQVVQTMQAANQQIITLLTQQPKPVESTAVATVKPGLEGMLDEVEKYKKLADMFGWSTNGARRNEAPPEPARKGLFGSIADAMADNPTHFLTGVTGLLALGANIVYNIFGKGPSVSPQEAMAKANGQPNPAEQQQAQNGPQPVARPPWPMAFIVDIQGAFIKHFYEQGMNGLTLAEWVLSDGYGAGPTDQGKRLYDTVKTQLGPIVKEGKITRFPFLELCQQYPPLWDMLKDPGNPMKPANPEKLLTFLNEFFSYYEIIAKEEQEEPPVGENANAA